MSFGASTAGGVCLAGPLFSAAAAPRIAPLSTSEEEKLLESLEFFSNVSPGLNRLMGPLTF